MSKVFFKVKDLNILAEFVFKQGTWLYLTFKNVAEVRESVNNYDEFSLIVEVGSSLGTDDIL